MFVLLIEDEPDLRELGQLALENAGMLVVTATDGARALQLLERIEPDVIVTDLMMPVLDGFGFLEAYRASGRAKAPVLAVSAFEGYLGEALAAGASATLLKPFAADAFVEAVRSIAGVAAAAPAASPSSSEPVTEVSAEEEREEQREEQRLRAVLDLGLHELAPERRLHDFVADVAAHFDVPIALLSVVDHERQFWSAGCGLPPGEAGPEHGGPREHAFCTHAVVARAALVVQDTL